VAGKFPFRTRAKHHGVACLTNGSYLSSRQQTFLRLAGVSFRILPSTNHASPTGALPFLLPARPQTAPIPSSKLQAYALEHGTSPIQQQQQQQPPPLRQDAYQALLDLPLRNAWLHALYLDPAYTPLLDDFYTTPASSSTFVRDTLRRRLRRAAEAEILKTGSYISSAAAGTAVVDEARVLDAAREALGGLASLLAESETGWFFDAPTPGLFDASVFAYTYLMVRYMSDGTDSGSSSRGKTHDDKAASSWSGLGDLVKSAGDGELAGHVRRVMEAVGWDGI